MALTATDLFNDATTREIGGVGPDQVNLIVSDLIGVQQMLTAADPTINNLSDLHTHVIINQLNEEIASVENANAPTTGTLTAGTDLGQYVGRSINDIHRDIIDIAQADPGVQALFNPTPLPALNTPPAPFHDNAAQTTFITQWIQDSNHLGQMATTIENNGFTGDIAGLVQQIQTYEHNSNAFDQAQGGLWSARFWNEFRSDGTSGTAANALIDGLQTHNTGELDAAVQQLAANSADVSGNNLMADGGSYASVVAAAQATAVTPNAATPPDTVTPPATTPPGTTPPATTPPATTPPAGPPDAGGPVAGDGGNHLVADLIALLQGGGQNSVSAVIADLEAVAQAAGAHNNGVATLLTDLQTAAAAPAAPTAANAPASGPAAPPPVATVDAGPPAAVAGPADNDAHHSHIGEMAQHFHHMWG
jgi:trimeric autotransporter adhesin